MNKHSNIILSRFSSSFTAWLLILICLENSKNSVLHRCSHMKTVSAVEGLKPELLVDKEDCLARGPCLWSRVGRKTCGLPFEALCISEDVKAAVILILGLTSHLLLLSPFFSSLSLLPFSLS